MTACPPIQRNAATTGGACPATAGIATCSGAGWSSRMKPAISSQLAIRYGVVSSGLSGACSMYQLAITNSGTDSVGNSNWRQAPRVSPGWPAWIRNTDRMAASTTANGASKSGWSRATMLHSATSANPNG